MRHSPTSLHIAMVVLTVVSAALAGCAATTNGDPESDPPASEETNGTEKKNASNGDTPAPVFNPSFDDAGTSANTKTDSGKGDPAPPDGDQCIDTDDPGGAENVAKVLPDTDDCDNDYKEVSGVMKGAVDVDYFKLSASDKTFCSLDTDFEGETAGTELCVYARCKNSTADAVTGCATGSLQTSDIGMKGCCAAAPGNATPTWDCSGFTDDDSADFYVSVKQPSGAKCLPYKFKYRY